MKEWISFILIIILVICFIYFPKKKEEKRFQELQQKLKVGDSIILFSGIHAKIENIEENTLVIILEPDNVRVVVEKCAVAMIKESKAEN